VPDNKEGLQMYSKQIIDLLKRKRLSTEADLPKPKFTLQYTKDGTKIRRSKVTIPEELRFDFQKYMNSLDDPILGPILRLYYGMPVPKQTEIIDRVAVAQSIP
jgi:hypothetical protein